MSQNDIENRARALYNVLKTGNYSFSDPDYIQYRQLLAVMNGTTYVRFTSWVEGEYRHDHQSGH